MGRSLLFAAINVFVFAFAALREIFLRHLPYCGRQDWNSEKPAQAPG
jgi:hypothetical protein